MSSVPAGPLIPAQKRATRIAFFSAGFITAAWAAIIPFIKINLAIGDGTMGLMLLCLGAGALVGMPLAGKFSSQLGCKPVLVASMACFSLLYPALIWLDSVTLLAVFLVLFGLCVGTTDCAMNIQGVAVEKEADKPLMSGFHGFYSLGGMSGAILMTAILSSGVPVELASAAGAVMSVAFLLAGINGFRTGKSQEPAAFFALPKGVVVLIGIVCSIVFLAEGTVLDWSGIYLTEYRDVSPENAGLGVACFSVAMTLGRLAGDKITSILGPKMMVLGGGGIAITGFALSLLVPLSVAALTGYVLIGLGCSNIVPIMFSATGKQKIMSEASAVTAVSTLGYVGVLAGPALVGFGAQVYGLPAALGVIAVLLCIATALAGRVRV